MELAEKDVDHLRTLRDVIAPARNLVPIEDKGSIGLYVSDRHMIRKLAEYGIVMGKSRHYDWPDGIPDEFVVDFIRGYFDGDGSLCQSRQQNDRWIFSVLGCEDFLRRMKQELEKRFNIEFPDPVHASGSPHLFRLCKTGNQVENLHPMLHRETYGLERKRFHV